MISKKDQIRKFERNGFQELKKKENRYRKMPISDDILYSSDFTLEIFENSGDSGKLYLATSKHNPNEKYILKHEYYDCACNEYMYSKIGNQMGIQITPVKLFVVNDKKNKFKSDFVCGIKYLDQCEFIDFNYIKQNKDLIENWEDYFRMYCLYDLFQEGDSIEIVKYKNRIYRLDTTSSFTISDFDLYRLAYDYHDNGIDIREFSNKYILKKATRNPELRFFLWNCSLDNFIKKFGLEYLKYYLDTFGLIKNITSDNIEEWTNILTFIYPNIVGDYFKMYFENLKLDVAEFLEMANSKYTVLN